MEGTMASIFTFDLPMWDTRGDKISKFDVVSTSDGGEALLLCCPEWIGVQVEAALDKKRVGLKESTAKDYTHGFRFKKRVPDEVKQFIENLTYVLSIPAPDHVDFAIALDWYTVPDDETGDLVHTNAGNWINWTKHAPHPEWGNSTRSRRKMVNQLIAFIQEHPIYSNATAIIAAPGHLGDGQSFGENLARQVAKEVGLPFVESTAAARTAQFEEKQDLTRAFTVQEALVGTVIVLDDVYQSGGSASGAAAAARRAGADNVLVLTVARTISR
jgi:hypothetical protein